MERRNWTQRDILQWAQKTFGWNGPLSVAIRGNKEMGELLSLLSNSDGNGPDEATKVAEECADVVIFMMQVAELMGRDLMGMVNYKMNVNSQRQWGKAEDGSFQHTREPEFIIVKGHKLLTENGICEVCGSATMLDECAGF